MDPLTAVLELANTVAKIILLAIESQPPDVRAEYARTQLEDWKAWRAFFEKLTPKG